VASDIKFIRIFLELFTLVLSINTEWKKCIVWAEIGSNIADNFQLYLVVQIIYIVRQ